MVDRRPIIRVESGTNGRTLLVDPHHEERVERRFRLLAEAIPQIVWTTRSDGYCDYTKSALVRLLGYSGRESRRAGVGWTLSIPRTGRGSAPSWPRPSRRMGALRLSIVCVARTGPSAGSWCGVSPFATTKGSPSGGSAPAPISTTTNAPDEALRRNGERLRLAAEAARLGYWDWDIVSDSITWSDSLAQISGTTPERFGLTFEGFLGLVHPDDRDRVAASVRRAVDEGTPYEEELKLANPDGTYRWGLTKGQVYYDRTGRPVRMSGIEVDITAREADQKGACSEPGVLPADRRDQPRRPLRLRPGRKPRACTTTAR